jgi:hypothetical protein
MRASGDPEPGERRMTRCQPVATRVGPHESHWLKLKMIVGQAIARVECVDEVQRLTPGHRSFAKCQKAPEPMAEDAGRSTGAGSILGADGRYPRPDGSGGRGHQGPASSARGPRSPAPRADESGFPGLPRQPTPPESDCPACLDRQIRQGSST